MKVTTALVRIFTVSLLAATLAACSSNPKTEPVQLAQLDEPTVAPIQLTESRRGPMLTLEDVQFDFEEASLRPEAVIIIKQAAAYLKNNPERLALVEGHTDNMGDAPYNQYLSDARSESVRQSLISFGIPDNRIKTDGFGETKPVASNTTREGRQANRRVEIIFQQPKERYTSL